MILSIPWLIIPVVSYFITVWLGGPDILTYVLTKDAKLMSGAPWVLTISELLLIFTLIVLFVEILKATRVSSLSLVDHSLSTLVFVICLILFIVYKPAGSSTFFLITIMTLIDVVAGFSITLRSARRDVGFATHAPN